MAASVQCKSDVSSVSLPRHRSDYFIDHSFAFQASLEPVRKGFCKEAVSNLTVPSSPFSIDVCSSECPNVPRQSIRNGLVQ